MIIRSYGNWIIPSGTSCKGCPFLETDIINENQGFCSIFDEDFMTDPKQLYIKRKGCPSKGGKYMMKLVRVKDA